MTEYWGPNLWHLMHTVSFNANDHFSNVEKEMLFYFYKNIGNMIPCIFCRSSYKRHLIDYPVEKHLQNKSSLCDWVIKIHNIVNASINKKLLTYNEAYENHKIIDFNKIIAIFRYLNHITFLNAKQSSLKNLLNFYRNLQYIFPTQKGRNILIYFFKNYPITILYTKINYFQNWYFNLEKWIVEK